MDRSHLSRKHHQLLINREQHGRFSARQSQFSPVSNRPVHARRYSIETTLIRKKLGWQFRHTFEQGPESTVRWFLDNLD